MLWFISLRYLLSHRRQTLVSIAGVAISVLMFLAMFAMMLGFREKFIIETVESTGHVVIHDEPRETRTAILERVYGDEHALLELERVKPRDQVKQIKNPLGLMRAVRALPGVTAVAPEVTGEAIAAYGTRTLNVAVVGIEPEQQLRVTTIGEKLIEGGFDRLRSAADGVVIGRGVALQLGAGLDDSLLLTSPDGARSSARVVGIFQTGVTPVDYARVYMLLSSAQTLLDRKNIINRMTVRSEDYTRAPALAAQIESMCGYRTESWQESNENFLRIFAIQDVITYTITGALLIVAAFGVLNIMIMAVLERVGDIAILKSFGYSRRDITLIFIMQGAVIGLAGASLGVLLGKLAIEGLRRLPIRMEGLVRVEGLLMSEHLSQYAIAFFAALLVVILAAVFPARRAARFDPVEIIRGAH